MAEPNKYKFWYSILTHPKCRIWRHLLLVFIIAVIAINETASLFGENMEIVGNLIWIPFVLTFVVDMAAVYFNLYFLVPRLLLRSKYIQYIGALCLSISVYILCDLAIEYCLYELWNIPLSTSSAWYSKENFIADFLSVFVTCVIFMAGLSMTILFKNLLINKQVFDSLETKKVRSELDGLKEQVSPIFLSKILKRASILAETIPEESSSMLLKLSKILRYQLYDCGRDKVLLLSEIEFLTNYLGLEKDYYTNFDYKITKDERLSQVFIPPLLFLPFIQQAIKCIEDKNVSSSMLHISFAENNNQLQFGCTSEDIIWRNSDCANLSHRLTLLYNNRYSISATSENDLTIQIEM